MKKTIVVVSDVQDGHKLSICSDAPKLSQLPPAEPTIYRPNRIQKALFTAWKEVTTEWNKPDILVINGEPIEGQQYKNMGTEVWSTDLNDQLNDAQKLIEMFKAKKIYTTRGSDYHVSLKGVPLEEAFGKMIGATPVGGYYAPYEFFLEEEGVTFDISHHVGYNMEFYRSTAITREMAFAKLNESHRWPAKVLIRSHVHYYWYVGSTSHLSMTTPCWKLQDWFMRRKTSAGGMPDIGAVRFTVEDGKFDWEAKIFKLPAFKPIFIRDGKEIKAK